MKNLTDPKLLNCSLLELMTNIDILSYHITWPRSLFMQNKIHKDKSTTLQYINFEICHITEVKCIMNGAINQEATF